MPFTWNIRIYRFIKAKSSLQIGYGFKDFQPPVQYFCSLGFKTDSKLIGNYLWNLIQF